MNTLTSSFQTERKQLLESISKTPDNTPAMVALVKLYLKEGFLQEAKDLLKTIAEHHPNSEEIQNNLGAILFRQKYHEEAVGYFILALKLKPDYVEAMYNLALAYKALDKESDAIASLLAIIEAEPTHVRAHFLMGKMMLEKKEYEKAGHYFQTIVELDPDDINLLESIIHTLLIFDRYDEAKIYCEKYLLLAPKSVEMNYLFGVVLARLNDKQRAMSCYHAALQINPSYFPALNNLAIIYLEQQNIAAAKTYFEQALKQDPENKSIQYSLNAISGGKDSSSAPAEYIRTLFDSYADHYEQHLTISLGYAVPETLKKIIQKHIKPIEPNWKILDLGCGTGLCGALFKDWATELVGVDLSPKMLNLAGEKNCFNELVELENVEFLSKFDGRFDLILAADVFIYQGSLDEILSASYRALTSGGLMAFTTEINTANNFLLQKTGRFSHAKGYILTLAKRIGFQVISMDVLDTRLQQNQRLKGHYWLLSKLK